MNIVVNLKYIDVVNYFIERFVTLKRFALLYLFIVFFKVVKTLYLTGLSLSLKQMLYCLGQAYIICVVLTIIWFFIELLVSFVCHRVSKYSRACENILLSESGLQMDVLDRKYFWEWGHLIEVVKTKRSVVFTVSSFKSVIIPLRCFESDEDGAIFYEYAKKQFAAALK